VRTAILCEATVWISDKICPVIAFFAFIESRQSHHSSTFLKSTKTKPTELDSQEHRLLTFTYLIRLHFLVPSSFNQKFGQPHQRQIIIYFRISTLVLHTYKQPTRCRNAQVARPKVSQESATAVDTTFFMQPSSSTSKNTLSSVL
jgi:hypothetical protein